MVETLAGSTQGKPIVHVYKKGHLAGFLAKSTARCALITLVIM